MLILKELVERRLRDVAGLSARDAHRAAREVLDLFDLNADEYIERRHGELQREGHGSERIYVLIRDELPHWRFRAPRLSLRQIRRRIYG